MKEIKLTRLQRLEFKAIALFTHVNNGTFENAKEYFQSDIEELSKKDQENFLSTLSMYFKKSN